MESKLAVAALSALAHETRLAVFRRLVAIGPGGLPAGDIAHDLGVVPATLSFHLGHLERTGLLRSWRVQRNVYYAADYDGMGRLIGFLMEDCCRGRFRFDAPALRQPAAKHQATTESRP